MLSLDSIRSCLEGAVPSSVSTCAADGTPNVTLVSQVHYVDSAHVALSFQFFNKTHTNVMVNPRATALVIDPETGAQYQLAMHYARTETAGPLFENMKAKLAGIASHTGMAGIFRLRGSDVYRVSEIKVVPGKTVAGRQPRRSVLPALRSCSARLNAVCDLSTLLDNALAGLELDFGVPQSMILMLDRAGKRLYTVASRGYRQSGVGSEIALGCGVVGVAAEQAVPIRITHMTAEYSYSRAIRDSVEREGLGGKLETAIPLPGLPESRSQLAVPILSGADVLGVLYVESAEDLRFNYDDEDALVTIASQLGTAIHALQQASEKEEAAALSSPADHGPAAGTASVIRHYHADDSIFIDDDYVIKGVAGAILCRLLANYLRHKRVDFTNRELRLDTTLGLPDITDNLEARLILLERRLAERRAPVRIEKTGRGRFRLAVGGPLTLVEM